MAAKRKPDLHYTGDAKMKAAALKSAAPVTPVHKDDGVSPVPSPAKELQDQLEGALSAAQPAHVRDPGITSGCIRICRWMAWQHRRRPGLKQRWFLAQISLDRAR